MDLTYYFKRHTVSRVVRYSKAESMSSRLSTIAEMHCPAPALWPARLPQRVSHPCNFHRFRSLNRTMHDQDWSLPPPSDAWPLSRPYEPTVIGIAA